MRLCIAACSILLAIASVARADDDSTARHDEAVRLGHEGSEAYKVGDYKTAFERFEAAYRLLPAPALVLNLSRTALKLGRCDDAINYALTYNVAFGESATASVASPQAWLASVKADCPELRITSEPPGAVLLIEGMPRDTSFVTPWKGRIPVGKHEIRARLAGYPEQRMDVDVIRETSSQLRLTFVNGAATRPEIVSTPTPPVAASPPPAPTMTPAPILAIRESSHPLRLRWEPFIPAGVAVVGLIVAITEGAWGKACPTTVGTPQDVENEELCQVSHGVAADVGWGLAGAGAITAGVLWLVLKPAAPSSTESAPSSPRVSITGNGMALSGRF